MGEMGEAKKYKNEKWAVKVRHFLHAQLNFASFTSSRSCSVRETRKGSESFAILSGSNKKLNGNLWQRDHSRSRGKKFLKVISENWLSENEKFPSFLCLLFALDSWNFTSSTVKWGKFVSLVTTGCAFCDWRDGWEVEFTSSLSHPPTPQGWHSNRRTQRGRRSRNKWKFKTKSRTFRLQRASLFYLHDTKQIWQCWLKSRRRQASWGSFCCVLEV